ARVLRRAHVPGGRRPARGAGGHGEEPDPLRVEEDARRARRHRDRWWSMNEHDEIAELLGAYALDAVEPEEAAAVEAHLAVCPRCAAEVADHREVAAMLAHSGAPAPEGLWSRISASLEEAPPEMELRLPRPGPAGDDVV